MNKTKIEWADYTWNPVTGCTHGCSYCYARKNSMRFHGHFNPEFHPERIADEMLYTKEPLSIFLGSMTDMFGDFIKQEWWNQILRIVEACPQHAFLVLTKRPENILKFIVDPIPNLWIGTSIDRDRYMSRLYSLVNEYDGHKFVSFEPLLEFCQIEHSDKYFDNIEWVITGGQTNPDIPPVKEWVEYLIRQCRQHNIPVFVKDNALYAQTVKEWPSRVICQKASEVKR